MSNLGRRRDAEDLKRHSGELATWLAPRLACSRAKIVEIKGLGGGAGFSNETFFVTVECQTASATSTREVVLRPAPGSHRLFKECDFEAQYRIIEALKHHSTVPVPDPVGFEASADIIDSAFFVIERVAGQVPADFPPYTVSGWLFDAKPAERRRVWESAIDALASVHSVPYAAFKFLESSRVPQGLDALFQSWSASLDWAAEGDPPAVLTNALAWLQANRPANAVQGFSWGDSRYANMLFDQFQVSAILDFEMASLAGPLVDLGWWLTTDEMHTSVFGITRPEGLGTREQTIERWQEKTGIDTRDIHWYEVFAAFRFAIIMIPSVRIFSEGQGLSPEQIKNTISNNYATHQISRLLGLELPGELLRYF